MNTAFSSWVQGEGEYLTLQSPLKQTNMALGIYIYYNKVPIYYVFYLLKGDYNPSALHRYRVFELWSTGCRPCQNTSSFKGG